MPLLFALAGIIALALSFIVLVGPVLLGIAVIRSVRTSRRATAPQPPMRAVHPASPVDGNLADATFADLIGREWPSESTVVGQQLP